MPLPVGASQALPFSLTVFPADDARVPMDARGARVPNESWAIVSDDGYSVSFSAKCAVNIILILRILKLFSAEYADIV